MQAIHVPQGGPASVLSLTSLPIPTIQSPYDILVKVKGVSLNPVDTKVRKGQRTSPIVLGFDASGIVEIAGESAVFRPGDEVIYAGVLGRPGTNAQYHIVDSRIVGRKPKGLSWEDSAGLPLVTLTAWEMFEYHFNLKPFSKPAKEETILIINGAGGVGSMGTQLAAKVFGIQNVIVTASRNETISWAKRNGATHVINHHQELGPQLEKLGLVPSLALICHGTDDYLEPLIKVMRPWGRIGSIVEATKPLPFYGSEAFTKALSFHWELMFTRPMKGYDVENQGRILNDLSKAVESGLVQSLATQKETLSVASLRKAHELVESGRSIGKVVFTVGETITEN